LADVYAIKISDRALRDLDGIYAHIASTLLVPETALKLVEEIEASIFSLDTFPQRCPERKIGTYANRGYRQLFVGNYTVLFRIDETKKWVIIVTVRYSPSQF